MIEVEIAEEEGGRGWEESVGDWTVGERDQDLVQGGEEEGAAAGEEEGREGGGGQEV